VFITDWAATLAYRFNVADLDALAERARSHKDFVTFLDALRADLRTDLSRPADEVAFGAGE
jgi:hypothetical protein